MPLHAAEEDQHVLMLYGLDPYLPPFLVMDKAMRESLASANNGRVIFFSELLDAQRFPEQTFEQELVGLFVRKYSSLDIEVFAYVRTTVWTEFLGIPEELLFRVMNIIERAGTALAFLSQTLYLGRDREIDSIRAGEAETSV